MFLSYISFRLYIMKLQRGDNIIITQLSLQNGQFKFVFLQVGLDLKGEWKRGTKMAMVPEKKEKKYDNSEIFIFPLSSEGLENVRSVFELMSLLETKFQKAYKHRPDVKCEYQFSFPRFYSYIQGLQYIKLVAHCKFCSHQLVYFKNLSFEQSYKLIAFRKYHVHTRDLKKIRDVYCKSAIQAPRIYRYEPYGLRMLRVKNQKAEPSMSPEEYMKSLPIFLRVKTKFQLVTEKYGLTEAEFNSILRKLTSQYDIHLKELLQFFDQNDYLYSYTPKNLVDVGEKQMILESLPHYSCKPPQLQPDYEQFQQNNQSIHFFDKNNPHIPNILVMVTPRMKMLFHEFGQMVGFDLTFSIVKEQPAHHKQYLTGIFGGTDSSKRITVFGVVVTNSQTVEAYKFIFSQFFKLVGGRPSSIITDEQKSVYYALKQLKEEGVFEGSHLLDMFHVLKKVRKSTDGNCFQLYRRILHVRDRQEYRRLLMQLKREISNEKELEILRIFDMNSHRYCFSQLQPRLVGTSISNSFNQKFHDVLKCSLPFASKYYKAVKILIEVSAKMNDSQDPDLQMKPFEETLNIPQIKPCRTMYSAKVFAVIVKSVMRAATHSILTEEETRRGNLEQINQLNCTQKYNKTSYFVNTKFGLFKVFKKDDPSIPGGKWYCHCEYEQKTGVFCSHIAKIILHRGETFENNMNPRWLVNQNKITKRLLEYKHVTKFLTLRSRHKIFVKGYRGYKSSREMFNNFNQESESVTEGQASSIANDLDFPTDSEEDEDNQRQSSSWLDFYSSVKQPENDIDQDVVKKMEGDSMLNQFEFE